MLPLVAKVGRTYTVNSNGNRFAEVRFDGGPAQLGNADRRIDVRVREGWKGSEETRASHIKAMARIQGIERRRLPPLLYPIDPAHTAVGAEVWVRDPDRVWPETATVVEPPKDGRVVVKFGPGAHAGLAGATRSLFSRVVFAKRDGLPTIDEVIAFDATEKTRDAEQRQQAKADEKAANARRRELEKAERSKRPGAPVAGSTWVTVEHMDPPVHGAMFRVVRTSKAADPLLKHTGGDRFLTRVKGSPKSGTPVWGESTKDPDWRIATAAEPGPARDPELDPIATLTERELAESIVKVGNTDRKRLLEAEERRRKRGGEPPKRTVLSAKPPTHRDPQGRKRGTIAVSDHRVLERQAAEKARAHAERQEAFTAPAAPKTSLADVGKLPAAAPAAPAAPFVNATDRMFLEQVARSNKAGLLYHADAFKPATLARLKGLADRGLVVEVKPGKFALPEHAGLSPSAAEEQAAARKAHFDHRVQIARFDAKRKAVTRGALNASDSRMIGRVRALNEGGLLLIVRGNTAADRRTRKHLESLVERGELVLVAAHGEHPAGYALNAPAPATPAPVVAAAAEKLADASGHLESALEHADKASAAAKRELDKVHEGKGSAAAAEKALSESRAALQDVREASKEVTAARSELQSPANLTPAETRLVGRVLAANRQGRLFNITGDTSSDRRASALLPGLVERMHLMLVQGSKTRGQGYAVPGHVPPERAPSLPPAAAPRSLAVNPTTGHPYRPAMLQAAAADYPLDDPHQRNRLMTAREIELRDAAIKASHGEASSPPEPRDPSPAEMRYQAAREQFLAGRQTSGWDALEQGDALLLVNAPIGPRMLSALKRLGAGGSWVKVAELRDAVPTKTRNGFDLALLDLGDQVETRSPSVDPIPAVRLKSARPLTVDDIPLDLPPRKPPSSAAVHGRTNVQAYNDAMRLLRSFEALQTSSSYPTLKHAAEHAGFRHQPHYELEQLEKSGVIERVPPEERTPGSVDAQYRIRTGKLTAEQAAARDFSVHHPDPPVISAFRKAVHDWMRDDARRVADWESLGWMRRSEGASQEIWSSPDGHRAMVMFGGPKQQAHLFQWVPPSFVGEGWPAPTEERAGAGNAARPALGAAAAPARKPPRRGGGAASARHEGGEETPSETAKPAKPPKAKVAKVRKPPKPKKPKVAQLKRWTCEGLIRVGCGGGARVVGVKVPRVKASIFTRL